MTQYCDVNRQKSTETYGGISLEVLKEITKKFRIMKTTANTATE